MIKINYMYLLHSKRYIFIVLECEIMENHHRIQYKYHIRQIQI